jgi:hypothetical protein
MQLKWRIGMAGIVLALSAGQAMACTLSLTGAGRLALSSDSTRLGSDEAGGSAAVVTLADLNVLSPNTITVSAPTLPVYPAGFASGSVTLQSAFSASWLLGSTNRPFSTTDQSFSVPSVLNLLVTVTIDNRVTSSAGFKQGNYATKTVVTCS